MRRLFRATILTTVMVEIRAHGREKRVIFTFPPFPSSISGQSRFKTYFCHDKPPSAVHRWKRKSDRIAGRVLEGSAYCFIQSDPESWVSNVESEVMPLSW